MAEIDSRWRLYVQYLDSHIDGYKILSQSESMMGSIACDGVATELTNIRNKLYELFPELKPQESRTPESPLAQRAAETPRNFEDDGEIGIGLF